MKVIALVIFYIFGICTVVGSRESLRKELQNQYELQNEPKCDVTDIDQLTLDKIIELAVINKGCRKEAMDIIHRTYNYTTVHTGTDYKFDRKNQILFINHHKPLSGFWEVFCPTFQHLRIECEFFDMWNAEKISVHCNETLKSLKIVDYESEGCYYLKFKRIFPDSQTFNKVESFSIDNDKKYISDAAINTSKIFPELKDLSIGRFTDDCIFDGKFAQLENFVANEMTSTNYSKFFTNNPHIQVLSVFEANMDYLKSAHDFLPQLQNFTFVIPANFRSYNGPKFIFENVKFLRIKDQFQTFDQTKLEFKPLENLMIDMNNTQLIDNSWITFIENHKHLSSLHTTERAYFHAKGLLNLARVTSLIEVNIFGGPSIEVQHVVTFATNCAQLQNFKLTFINKIDWTDFVKYIERLRNELNENWQIIQSNDIPLKFLQLIKLK